MVGPRGLSGRRSLSHQDMAIPEAASMRGTGAVLAPPSWGSVRAGTGSLWPGHRRNFVGHMFKYALFDINP